MALPLDNPSYFAVASGTLPCSNKGKFRLFKKKMGATTSQEAIGEVTALKNNGKMPLRTLLRSVSSNSADSNQELLVLGEPRPSDIAPPSPYMHSHREETRAKGKKPKANGEIVNNDLLYCPLATSEEAADEVDFSDAEEEEVFLTEDSAKYYNLSASRETGRRHSVGTYLLQERDRALSVASSSKSCREDVPQVHATLEGDAVQPAKPASSSSDSEVARSTRSSRRRCPRCNMKGAGCGATCASGMDDILIVSSKGSHAASLWVQYFGNCFDQYSKQKERPPYKVFHLGIEEVNDGTGISPQLEQRVSSVRLQMVIVCPQLLEYVASEPRSSAALCNLLKPDRTIAMLLGVTDEDLTDVHHTALVSYRQWSRHQVGQDQDQDFARDFLAAAVGIMTKVARQQHAAALEERTTFSIMPKKVKQSQNRLIVLLAEPLARDDTVRVSVDKNGELMEVKPVKRRNPYTLKFTMPDRCMEVSSIVNVLVEKNGNVLGARPVKCESRLRELDQILRTINDPVEFMCQTLGFSPSNSEQLDGWMVHSFQRNLPPHFNLVATTAAPGASRGSNSNRQSPARHPHGHEEYPTLLHFAARYGLERLAWQLLECPGGEAACELRNACDMTPAEIAENAGHVKLASALIGYMQMNEFTNMYSQLKELSQTKQETPATATAAAAAAAALPTVTATPDVDEDEYLLPRSAELTYSVPPPARPYSPAANRPITGYLEMQPTTKLYAGRTTPTLRTTPAHPKHTDQLSETSSKPATPLPPAEMGEGSRPATEQTYEDKVQGELLEIINDFKNNVFTLSEVEHLVENWRKRNDVQKSFKEKEEQLNSMRKEYDRIQQIMKEEMKRATPFDRIRKLFSRGNRNKGTERAPVAREMHFSGAEEKSVGDGAAAGGQSHLRPISSLSLQSTASSSSSGRMSTLSGCSAASLGDSGTHSDHEDRKHLMRQTSSDHEYFEINDPKKNPGFNYLIPPTPKPVYKYNPLKQHTPVQQFSTITERPPQPAPNDRSSDGDEYYIQFPPSGLPVAAPAAAEIKPIRSASPEAAGEEASTEYLSIIEDTGPLGYMNLPAPGATAAAADEEELPEYMNFQPAPASPAPALPPRNY